MCTYIWELYEHILKLANFMKINNNRLQVKTGIDSSY